MLRVCMRRFLGVLFGGVLLSWIGFMLYLFITTDYTCKTDTSYDWCDYYRHVNITIIGYENKAYIGEYIDNHMTSHCAMHDYHETPKIGYHFMGYYQKDLPEKCVTKKHRDTYMERTGNDRKSFESIFFVLLLFVSSSFLWVVLLKWFIYTDEFVLSKIPDLQLPNFALPNLHLPNFTLYNQVNQESIHNNIVNNEIVNNDIEIANFENIKTQLENTHYITSPDLNDICIYCCEKLSSNSILIALPCGHWFHKSCINCNEDTSNKLKNKILTCPTCNIKM